MEAPPHGVIRENTHTGNITCETTMEYMAADIANYIEIAHRFQPMLVQLNKHVCFFIYHMIAFFLCPSGYFRSVSSPNYAMQINALSI